ncbi:MAG: hypothetical protein RPU64_09820 [Candidatus Sedimenticola sp. (ex Thyasira tokunagai)]
MSLFPIYCQFGGKLAIPGWGKNHSRGGKQYNEETIMPPSSFGAWKSRTG